MSLHLRFFREVELNIQTTGVVYCAFYTDLPGAAMAARHVETVDNSGAGAGRRPYKFRLPGGTQGRLCKARIYGTGAFRLFGARVFCKVVGVAAPQEWGWVPLPVTPTPEDFAVAQLPIPETPEGFSVASLPILGTGEDWQNSALPFPETPGVLEWADLVMDE